ncbi:MAG: hypothetical protein RLZZ203_948 [Cyanobacteriota bacterium]
MLPFLWRDVAQFGSALRSGRRGRRFKSCHPDSCHLTDYLTALTNWCPSCQIIVRVAKLPSHQGVLALEAITIIAFIYWYCFSYGKSRTKCAFQPT